MLTIKEKLELTAAVTMLERLERALVRKRKAATALAERADAAAAREGDGQRRGVGIPLRRPRAFWFGGARGDRGGRRTPGCTTADRPSRST